MHRFTHGLFTCVAALAVAGVAGADTVTVQYQGIDDGRSMSTYRDGTYHRNVFAGEMDITIDGEGTLAYCVDLDHTLPSQPYEANLVDVMWDETWCEIAWILDNYEAVDSLSSAGIQVAIWKLVEEPVWMTVNDAAVEDFANDLLAEAEGMCPLLCDEAADLILDAEYIGGEVFATATVTNNGVGVFGEEVTFTTDFGTIVSPPGGVGVTDVDGIAEAVIDLGGAMTPPTVSATVEGIDIQTIEPVNPYQQLLAFDAETCELGDELCVDLYECADWGVVWDYNLFSCNDYYGGVDVLGKAAIAHATTLENFAVGLDNQGGNALVVGWAVALQYGTVYGDAVYGSLYEDRGGVTFMNGGGWVQGSPIDFAAECANMENVSDILAALPANGLTTVYPWGGITMMGNDSTINVFEVAGEDIVGANSIQIDVPAGATVLVNITGDYAQFRYMGVSLVGVDRNHLLWNAADATMIEVEGVNMQGSMIAVRGTVSFNNASWDGSLVAGDVRGYGEFHWVPFGGEICYGAPCEDPEPPEPPVADCAVDYNIVNSWPGGFQVEVVIHNTGAVQYSGWELGWTFTQGETAWSVWNGNATQAGDQMTVTDVGWNSVIQPGNSVSFGFTGGPATVAPAEFTLDGATCQ